MSRTKGHYKYLANFLDKDIMYLHELCFFNSRKTKIKIFEIFDYMCHKFHTIFLTIFELQLMNIMHVHEVDVNRGHTYIVYIYIRIYTDTKILM